VTRSIAIVDLIWAGHHPSFLKFFARALLEQGHRVIALCPQPQEMEDWLKQSHPAFAGRFRAARAVEPENPDGTTALGLRATLARWTNTRAALAALGESSPLVLFAWLDTLLHPLLRPLLLERVFPHDWAGLYFHPRHLRVAATGLRARWHTREMVAALRSRRCRGVFVLDEGIAAALSAAAGGKRVFCLPDIADTSGPDTAYGLARQLRERAAGRCVIGLAGGIAWRKGVTTLIAAARALPPERFFFVMAGPLFESTFPARDRETLRAFVARPPENWLLHFERIPGEAQFNAVLAQFDIVFAAYRDFPHSSNLLAKAAHLRKPLLVSRGHLMAERTARYRLGLAIDEGDAGQCARAIEALAAGPDPAADPAGYLREHSAERFAAVLEGALREMR
jgi:glycosyltransferase involved in cell wall biosynthesis